MAQSKLHLLVPLLLLVLLQMTEAKTPPGLTKPSHARCNIKKYKHCYNLEHVCPKFCPNECTVECVSCKPICVGVSSPNPPNSGPSPEHPSLPTPTPPPSTPTPPSTTPTSPYPPTPSTTSTPSPITPSPKPPSPLTPSTSSPSTPSTPLPSTPSPVTPSPKPPTPATPSPSTPSTPYPTPSMPSPSTPSPVTPSPKPPTPATPSPFTPSPSTPTPSPPTPLPTTPFPTPSTPSPTTPSPTPSPSPSTPFPTPPSTTPTTPSPTPPTVTPSPTTPSTPSPPTPFTPSPTPSSHTPYPPPDQSAGARAKRTRCKNKNYPQCYNTEHVCPSSCPGECEVDCITCKPVCICQDPRFIGGAGITFYFHGKKDHDFCLLSDPDLHINAHFIGKHNANMKRDFTWVQSIGIIFSKHQLFVGALKTATWDDSVDRLTITFDGEPISLPEFEGARWQSKSVPSVFVVRGANTNNVMVEVEGSFRITTKVVPITQEDSRIHNYGITKEDTFAHLDLGFKFFSLSSEVSGVLGQTYISDYMSLVNIGAKMPVMGGDREFKTSNLFATDCVVAKFKGIGVSEGEDSLEGLGLPSLSCANGLDGQGVICKK